MNTVKPKMNTMKKGGTSRAPKKMLPKAQAGNEVPRFKNPNQPASKDSSEYFIGKERYYTDASNNLKNYGDSARSVKADSVAAGALKDLNRQGRKGLPGFTKDGYPEDYKKKGGATKAKPMMKKGGSMPMVKKDGKMVPSFAADGKGKMMYGGAKKSMMKKGGATRKK
jgi:hypothetical protein